MSTKLQTNQLNEIIANLGYPCQGRLTLTSGTPITTSDVTAATTIYFTPYNGNHICLYNGSNWKPYTFTELSLSLSGYTADSNYDVFVYDNSGTLTLEGLIWSTATTRATEITAQDGIYVKSGAVTRRYLGTIRITSTTGQCEDSLTKRFVWNYYNRTIKHLYKEDSTGHSYTTATYRYWNNDSTQHVDFIIGVVDSDIFTNIKISNTEVATTGAPRLALTFNDSTTLNTNLPFTYCQLGDAARIFVSCYCPIFPPLGFTKLSVMQNNTSGNGTALWVSYHITCEIFG